MSEKRAKANRRVASGKYSPDEAITILTRANGLRDARRSVFDPQWQRISQYFDPEESDINTKKTESTTNWFDRIYESTPIRAASTCSVGVRNWVTPSTEQWLGLEPPTILRQRAEAAMSAPGAQRISRMVNPAQSTADEAIDDATRWCSEAAVEASTALSGCNFYSVIQPFNRSACVFGTALLFCEEGKEDTLCFEYFKVGTFVIAENDQKRVDTVFRWFKLTHRQAAQKFGEENLPDRIRKQLKQKPDEMSIFVHCVYPNEEYDPKKLNGGENLPVSSVYLSEDDKEIVEKSGYYEMPYFALRWSRWGTEGQVYGCSPGYETLAEARQLNYVTQFGDALVELQAYPRFILPDNLTGEVQLAAGGATYVKADDMARNVVPKEWQTQGRTDALEMLKNEKREAIKSAFFVDIFTMLGQMQDERMTAFEVAQRVGEKLDQFTGTFDQYVTDLINPLVRRVLGILVRGGHVAPPPDSMFVQTSADPKAPKALAVPKVTINSRVTLSLKQLRNVGMQQTMELMLPVVQAGRPDVMDNINLDKWVRQVARSNGVPESVLTTFDEMKQMRDARAQQMQAQMQAQQAQQLGQAGAGLGKSPGFVQDAAKSAMQAATPAQAAA